MKKNNSEIIDELKMLIDKNIGPLIDGDYVLWDLPYHKNIGDTLIWQGTLDFLASTGYHLIDYGSRLTASLNKVKENTIICLQGGGNWGDIYRSSQNFRNFVINKFPNNKIVVFPQSIYYKDREVLKRDSEVLSNHKNLHICVRDLSSYDIAKQYFLNANILLVPDMAFYIDVNKIKIKTSCKKDVLFLNRKDVESSCDSYSFIDKNSEKLDVSDWPTFERKHIFSLLLSLFNKVISTNTIEVFSPIFKLIIDNYAQYIYKPFLLRIGFNFLEKYSVIYTTRLHVGILSILLNKKVVFLDNSYGKLSSFYEQWLLSRENSYIESSAL